MSALPKFTGHYEHSLDDKGRLTIPARFRARLGDHFVLTIAPPDPCLAMYPETTWSEFCAKLESATRKVTALNGSGRAPKAARARVWWRPMKRPSRTSKGGPSFPAAKRFKRPSFVGSS